MAGPANSLPPKLWPTQDAHRLSHNPFVCTSLLHDPNVPRRNKLLRTHPESRARPCHKRPPNGPQHTPTGQLRGSYRPVLPSHECRHDRPSPRTACRRGRRRSPGRCTRIGGSGVVRGGDATAWAANPRQRPRPGPATTARNRGTPAELA